MTRVVDEAAAVVADAERIVAWLLCAKQGDEFVYATRCGLPPASPGAKAAREAQALGLVTLFQRAVPGRKERNYVARRTAKPMPVLTTTPSPAAANDVPQVDEEARAVSAVLNLLRRAAKFQRPCPTDFALARRAGVARDDIKRVMDLLSTMGLIRVQRAPAPTLRQVTIVGTGHRTGLVA
ncbi:hypothetical protein ACVOMT_11570 [Sphingomonas panni]